jgi:SNF2 family DNA or RNA helicase
MALCGCSQFRAYLNGLHAALVAQGFGVGKFYDKTRHKDLERFKKDPDCHVLLLGKEGSHGLDLSLATHIFLM